MFTSLKNALWNRGRYREHPEAVVVSCYFNPQRSPYRTKAFERFYGTIKHLNHLILECVVGDAKPELPENANIQRVYTENLLWHKEALLNLAVSRLPSRYEYVFWVDADVLFTNLNWLTDSVAEFQTGARVLQPFEYCVHLGKDEERPSFDVENYKSRVADKDRVATLWRSFCANAVDRTDWASSNNYNTHGHVGFAWGATREVLETVPLYDRALIGGADHIIAHASVGQIPHPCIEKSFTEDLDAVYSWSRQWYEAIRGHVAYARGDLYHLWHGDIDKRQYLKRIQEFTPSTKRITEKDKNGLYVTKTGDDAYIKSYFKEREVKPSGSSGTTVVHYPHHDGDDGFLTSMALGYMTDSPLIGMLGGNPAGAIVGAAINPGHQHHNPIHRDTNASETFS